MFERRARLGAVGEKSWQQTKLIYKTLSHSKVATYSDGTATPWAANTFTQVCVGGVRVSDWFIYLQLLQHLQPRHVLGSIGGRFISGASNFDCTLLLTRRRCGLIKMLLWPSLFPSLITHYCNAIHHVEVLALRKVKCWCMCLFFFFPSFLFKSGLLLLLISPVSLIFLMTTDRFPANQQYWNDHSARQNDEWFDKHGGPTSTASHTAKSPLFVTTSLEI